MIDAELKKLFSERQVGTAAVLGGPLPAGILFYLNYKRLGKEKEAFVSLVVSLLFTTVMFFMISKLPDDVLEKIPNPVFTAIYGIIVYFAFKHFLAKEIEEKIKTHLKESNWIVALVVFIGLVVTIIIALTFASVTPAFPGKKVVFGNLQHEIFYDQGESSKEDVDKLGNLLTEDGFFGSENKAAIRLERENNDYRVTFPIQKEFWDDRDIREYLTDLKLRLKQLYQKDIVIIMESYSLSGKTERKEI